MDGKQVASGEAAKEKALLRKQMAKERGTLSSAEHSERSAAAVQHLLALAPLAAKRTVMAFYPLRDELDIRPFLDCARQRGQEVWLPLSEPANRRMLPYLYKGRDYLRRGAFGIWEPDPYRCPQVDPNRLEAVVIPGLAFDCCGGRLGYGGGYYDRFLAGLAKRPLLVGVAFSLQLVTCVPREKHDISLDYLVTEQGVLGPFAT